MQTVYSQKEVLMRYLSETEADLLCKHFVANYNFDESFTSKEQIARIVDDVNVNYDNYVMKPSGDGGGHCIFGEDIPKLIKKVTSAKDDDEKESEEDIKLGGWILMEKIAHCAYPTCHIRNNEMSVADSIHEVGIYSRFLCDAKTGDLVLMNDCIGDVVRTRKAQYNEAGIGKGYGVVQSLILDAGI